MTVVTFWANYYSMLQIFMPRPLKRGILGASTVILSKDIDKYAFMPCSIFYETDVNRK